MGHGPSSCAVAALAPVGWLLTGCFGPCAGLPEFAEQEGGRSRAEAARMEAGARRRSSARLMRLIKAPQNGGSGGCDSAERGEALRRPKGGKAAVGRRPGRAPKNLFVARENTGRIVA